MRTNCGRVVPVRVRENPAHKKAGVKARLPENWIGRAGKAGVLVHAVLKAKVRAASMGKVRRKVHARKV